MSEMKKNYLSATRFAKAVYCGLLGHHLSNEDSNIPSFVFERGKQLHDAIDAVLQEGQEFPSAIPEHFKPYIPQLEEIIPNAQEKKIAKFNNKEVECIGIPDLRTNKRITEFKSGAHSEWHKWQTAFYKWLFDVSEGLLLYFDIPELIIHIPEDEKEFIVTDELIIKTWTNVLLKTPNRCKLCSSCPVKKSCPEWKGKANEDMLDLVEVVSRAKELTEQKTNLMNQFIEPISTELTKLKEREEFLREKIAAENEKANNFEVAGATIRISFKETPVLPNNFKAPTEQERPDLYLPRELDSKKVKKEFSVKEQKPVVTVVLN
jgi:hypothetical protein